MVDAADVNPNLLAMIALLPTTSDWYHIKLPHMTLVYAGLTKDLKSSDFNKLAKDAGLLAKTYGEIKTRVLGIKTFGDVEKVDALNLQTTPELKAMRRSVEHWNASVFPFNPHSTIGPSGSANSSIPNFLVFDRILAAWGDQKLIFKFSG